MTRLALLAAATVMTMTAVPAGAGPRPAPPPTPRPDLADIAAGSYYGNVVSDARGSGQSDVTITVTKTGPNTVSIASSYPRLPTFTTRLTRAMQTIQQTGTQPGGKWVVFLLDLSKTPHHLDITDDDASWGGDKQ